MGERDRADVAVVGAGAAGVGVGVALSMLDLDVRIVDREAIGASFRRWPEEMRFITPSFPSNGFGLPDLNAVTPQTSPAYALGRQQPSGEEYAEYLERVVEFFELDVGTGVEVEAVRPVESPNGVREEATEAVAVDGGASEGVGFVLETSEGALDARFVVWAGGQFGSPRRGVVGGEKLCVHTAEVDSWAEYARAASTREFLVVGGYESGIDAAVGLVEAGASVTVVDRGEPWDEHDPDPSEVLSPYTRERLDAVRGSDRLSLVGGIEAERVERTDDGGFVLVGSFADEHVRETPDYRHRFTVPTRPLLATGFEPTLGPVAEQFPRRRGTIELTDRDESPEVPGLFLAGPDVTHRGVKFCFVYKFRSRFPVVAETIGERLGVETDVLEVYRENNVFLDDLSCCEEGMCEC